MDELDKLLAQWDEETAASPPQPQPFDIGPQLQEAALEGLMQRARNEAAQEAFQQGVVAAREFAELQRTVDQLAEDSGTSPEIVRGFIRGLPDAERERVDRVWEARSSNKYAMDHLRAELVAKLKAAVKPPIDEEATADYMAVTAAVRGSVSEKSMPAEPAPRLDLMSTEEYRHYLASIGVGGF